MDLRLLVANESGGLIQGVFEYSAITEEANHGALVHVGAPLNFTTIGIVTLSPSDG